MSKDRFKMAMLFPLLAVATIAIFAGGLGYIFIVINEVVWKEWSVVIVGVAIVVGVPGVAALLQARLERQ